MFRFHERGITVIETLLGLAILAIIVAIVTFSFSGLKNSQALNNAVQNTLSGIDKARSMAFASIDSTEYGVHFGSDQIVVFSGTVYDSGSLSNEPISVSPASISNITLSGGGSDIYFNRLTGVPNKTGTITISVSGLSKIITISATGTTSVN